ncbi:MAG: Cys-tRNA(Pro) deacylase [Erysipelotrichaceae bacterium]|nr:Cys-tRNA(Pro) deacylase [Erysipelotrichaceae bacterium]
MAKTKTLKTNALRQLDKAKINYEIKTYDYDEDHLSGDHIVGQVDMDAGDIYKTLVLKGDRDYLVCCIPVLETIDLKKLAKLSGHKKVEMIPLKDLLAVTGYMRGGCSPIGMKKQFPTYMDESALRPRPIALSAGKRGYQMVLMSTDLINFVHATCGDVIR